MRYRVIHQARCSNESFENNEYKAHCYASPFHHYENHKDISMIFIVVKQKIRRKFADDWLTLVADFTEASRAEPGNLIFEWYRSPEDPNLYLLVEAFKDAAAGEAHVESEHFKAATVQLREWLAAVPEIVHVEAEGEGWAPMG
jgi:quinol monooxygenase YgiN